MAALLVSVSGLRDLSPLLLMLSFPASILAGVIEILTKDGLGWDEPAWLVNGLLGLTAIGFGYVQWFVIGSALARRIRARLPPHRALTLAARVLQVVVFGGLGLVGLELVRARGQAEVFIERAVTVDDGMTMDQVRAILGEPNEVQAAQVPGGSDDCPAPAIRSARYWYEHPYLPRRISPSGFLLTVCVDEKGTVIDRSTTHFH